LLRVHPGLQSGTVRVQPPHLADKAAHHVPQLGKRKSLQRCCIRQRHAGCESRQHPQRNRLARESAPVTSAAYDAALRQRGRLTIWFTDEAIAGWRAAPCTTPGGQPWYSPLAVLTALTLRAVFRLALRQTEGLIGSIVGLLGLVLAVPDHSTLSRRAKTLEAAWCTDRLVGAEKLGRVEGRPLS